MKNNFTVGITTVSFSKDKELVRLLESKGLRVLINEYGRRLSNEELISFLNKCRAAIIGLDKINEDVLNRVPDLKCISKYGVGLDNIDFEACERYGVKVLYSAGVNRRSVAEMALGFMVSLCRNLYISSNRLKAGEWDKNGGMQLSGKTVGLIGVGNIGKEVVSLLKPFGCKILVNDIIEQSAYYTANGLIDASKDEIYSQADVISVHTPLNNSTVNMIDSAAFAKMKRTAFVLNTARGGIINENDLMDALKSGLIAGAAIDAYVTEPPVERELIELPNLICTPHIGGNAAEAVDAMGYAAIDNLTGYLEEQGWL